MDIGKITDLIEEEADKSFLIDFKNTLDEINSGGTVLGVHEGVPYVYGITSVYQYSNPRERVDVEARMKMPDADSLLGFHEGNYEDVFILRNYFRSMADECDDWLNRMAED